MKAPVADQLVCPECRRPPNYSPIERVTLTCSNPSCAKEYRQLTKEIPIVVPGSFDAILEYDTFGPVDDLGDLPQRIEALAIGDPTWNRLVRVGMYVCSHYGDDQCPFEQIVDFITSHISTPIQAAADLGCGPGALAIRLANQMEAFVVGMDSNPLNLRWAAAAAAGLMLNVPVLRSERQFGLRKIAPDIVPDPGRVEWVCGDVAHPPLPAEAFDLVAAVNLLDSVTHPLVALGQAAALVRPKGHLLIAQPNAWDRKLTPVKRWLPERDAGWEMLFNRLGLKTVGRFDGLRWVIKRNPRVEFVYILEGRLAQKVGSPEEE